MIVGSDVLKIFVRDPRDRSANQPPEKRRIEFREQNQSEVTNAHELRYLGVGREANNKRTKHSRNHEFPYFMTVPINLARSTFLLVGIAALIAISISTTGATVAVPGFLRTRLSKLFSTSTNSSKAKMSSATRTPIYFLSHGGPNIMYEVDHIAYKKLQTIGHEITTKVKPKAVLVVSAHWQAGRNTVEINTAEKTDLIYDFYGFPSYYYKETFPHVGSKEVAERTIGLLKDAGIQVEGVTKGPDHGVWASFKCLFDPEDNPLNVPIVQLSLFGNEDPDQHYRLGQAIAALREEGVQIIVSGSAVHNLRDLRFGLANSNPLPYAVSFDKALTEAVTAPVAERQEKMAALMKRPDARQAHPEFSHLLPVYVGAGAAGDDEGKLIWSLPEGSMSWTQYRFGDIPTN